MVFEEDLKETDSASSIGSPSSSNEDNASMDHDNGVLPDDPESLAKLPMERGAFMQLSKNSKILIQFF